MVDVEQITVDIHVPSDEVRVVAMQPFVQLRSRTEEPFQWSDSMVNGQMDAVHRTLDLAQNGFGGSPANFTLFPEYSIPGAAGGAVINERVTSEAWPNESVIIAGVHGLTKDEYRELCQELAVNVSLANAPDSVPDGRWVNCCITWIKDRNGRVQTWVQPKIRPAWPEMSVTCNDMFCGSTVYVFRSRYTPHDYPCNFVTLICYDWVAAGSGTTVCDEVLNQLNAQWDSSPTPLHWVFVIQANPNPNHQSFLSSTYRFLTNANAYPFVERKEAVVLHANTAVSERPSRSRAGAFTACVFSPSAQLDCTGCRPTVCMQPVTLRGSNILARCKDVVFREMGECIHLFKVRVPRFVVPDATDRTYPLLDAQVHAATEVDDPRIRGLPVPAAVKWLNDSLDCVTSLSTSALAGRPLRDEAEAFEPIVISGLRVLNGRSATDHINWAACSISHGQESRNADRQENADLWDQLETDALEHIVHSLTSLGLTYDLAVGDTSLHGTLTGDSDYVQIVAIRGETYEDCRSHYDRAIPKVRTDPVLVIARDRDNLKPTNEEFLKIHEPDSEHGLRFLDYQSLVTRCREAEDKDILRGYLDDFIPRNRRII
ncbi:hypothetical protein MYX82_01265 [Acidobacteria bacterium AH-259-D05]|nr:hypothetical protein [Acidobacteria bacterium AH-259-D05]